MPAEAVFGSAFGKLLEFTIFIIRRFILWLVIVVAVAVPLPPVAGAAALMY